MKQRLTNYGISHNKTKQTKDSFQHYIGQIKFIVPFIWHDKFLKEAVIGIEKGFKDGRYKKGYKYNPEKEKKVLGIMEPNINIVKYGLIPTMIAEESFRTEAEKTILIS